MRVLLVLMFLAPFGAMAAIRAGDPVLPVWIAMSIVALIVQATIELRQRR